MRLLFILCVVQCLNTYELRNRGARINLCVFTDEPKYLKSLRILVPKTFWTQFADASPC
jgi:hypothetical protein